jgi:hypothetical protein
MKSLQVLILVIVGLFAPIYSHADQDEVLPPSAITDIYRQCYVAHKNCERAQALGQKTTVTGQPDLYKQQLTACDEAKIDLSKMKSPDALIAHNYKLSVCAFKEFDSLGNTNVVPSVEVISWVVWLDNYYSTEYQLGHITKDQYVDSRNREGQVIKALNDSTDTSSTQTQEQAQEIEQLKAQIAALQSADHERCRQIQILAALHGATPQVCP